MTSLMVNVGLDRVIFEVCDDVKYVAIKYFESSKVNRKLEYSSICLLEYKDFKKLLSLSRKIKELKEFSMEDELSDFRVLYIDNKNILYRHLFKNSGMYHCARFTSNRLDLLINLLYYYFGKELWGERNGKERTRTVEND